jgi:hypothetical protein
MIYRDIKLVYSESGDWVGVYANGKLLHEGHDISPSMLLEVLGIEHDRMTASGEWLGEEVAHLPEKWLDVPLDKLKWY